MFSHPHEKRNMQISERVKFRRYSTLLIKSFVFLHRIVPCKIQWLDQLALLDTNAYSLARLQFFLKNVVVTFCQQFKPGLHDIFFGTVPV